MQFRRSDHLFYLFMPQLAAGRIYCSSILDTLLYQVLMITLDGYHFLRELSGAGLIIQVLIIC